METYRGQVDVLIVGGGTAGALAAIQAGRAGAKTAVVEMHSQLGGTMTTGGVSAPACFWSSERQIVAGRSVSSDRLANSALRVEASCMAMGQAAGAAAALGTRQGIPSRDVPLQAIRTLLNEHAAIVPPGAGDP